MANGECSRLAQPKRSKVRKLRTASKLLLLLLFTAPRSPNRYPPHLRFRHTALARDTVEHTHATSHDLSRRSLPSPRTHTRPLTTSHVDHIRTFGTFLAKPPLSEEKDSWIKITHTRLVRGRGGPSGDTLGPFQSPARCLARCVTGARAATSPARPLPYSADMQSSACRWPGPS